MPISGQNVLFPPFFSGDGTNGRKIVSAPLTLTSSMMYDSLVVKSTLTVSGHRIFSKGLIRVSAGGSIVANGSDAIYEVKGNGAATGEVAGGGDGGTSASGADAAIDGLVSPTGGSLGGDGGVGSALGPSAGGRTAIFYNGLGARAIWLKRFLNMYDGAFTYPSGLAPISGGGGGGPGGAVAPATTRAGSGGGGAGVVWLACDTLWLEDGATITANGGAGGAGEVTGASRADGGSGGGGGGAVVFCNKFINETGSQFSVTGGAGGSGVNGGGAGNYGGNGNIVIFTPQKIIASTTTYPV